MSLKKFMLLRITRHVTFWPLAATPAATAILILGSEEQFPINYFLFCPLYCKCGYHSAKILTWGIHMKAKFIFPSHNLFQVL